MGSRMYVVEYDGKTGRWRRIYHHWGADRIKALIEEQKKPSQIQSMINRIVRESTAGGEKWEYFDSLDKAVDLSVSDIELYVVKAPGKTYLIYTFSPFISGGLAVPLKDSPAHNLLSQSLYDMLHSFIIVAHGAGVPEKRIHETLRRFEARNPYYFQGRAYLVTGSRLGATANLIAARPVHVPRRRTGGRTGRRRRLRAG